MPRLAANLSFLFPEVPLEERFARAARAGFKGVEMLFPYAWQREDLARWLDESGLAIALFNAPPGDWDAGQRGLAAIPGQEEAFLRSIRTALGYADSLTCPTLHVMSGVIPEGVAEVDRDATLVGNLQRAAELASQAGVTIVIEPLNNRDVPDYHLSRIDHARRIVDRVGADNVALQFDFYHVQIMDGDLARRFETHAERIAHVQIAGVPERNEPDTGEVRYPYLLNLLDRVGYSGWVGCEYRPRGLTEEGLGWGEPWGLKASPSPPAGEEVTDPVHPNS